MMYVEDMLYSNRALCINIMDMLYMCKAYIYTNISYTTAM